MGKFYPLEVIDDERHGGIGPVRGLSMDASRSDVVYPTCVVSLLSFRSATGAPSVGNGEDNLFALRPFIIVSL